MSLEQLESSILSLNPDERKQFARWFKEYRHELCDDAGDDELTPARHRNDGFKQLHG
jgi:hypothetical protein